jgi:hypothetical protein
MDRMRLRRFWWFVLIAMALVGQSFASARIAGPFSQDGGLEHVLLHAQGEAHHHHDDGSFHLDDSSESVVHVALDQGSSTAASPDGSSALPVTAHALPAHEPRAGPAPFLEGPLRPPRVLG